MKSAQSTDFESVLKKFDSMNAVIKRESALSRDISNLGNEIINPELYMQLYPMDDDIFQTPYGYGTNSAEKS